MNHTGVIINTELLTDDITGIMASVSQQQYQYIGLHIHVVSPFLYHITVSGNIKTSHTSTSTYVNSATRLLFTHLWLHSPNIPATHHKVVKVCQF